MSNYIEERIFYPTGCSPDQFEAPSFAVYVLHMGGGKWMVSHDRSGYYQLSKTGEWVSFPSDEIQQKSCRFSFAAACRLAEMHVDAVTVNGTTFVAYAAKHPEWAKKMVTE